MPRLAKIERKIEYFPIIGGEIKATNDAKGITEGYLNYIGNIDFGNDRTMPGAFKKTLSDSYARKTQQDLDYLWPYLFNHDYSQLPPGGIFEANEDRKGLYIKTQFNLDIQMGRELYSSFKMGTMRKQSMGYRAIAVDWVKEEGKSIRNLLEVAVMEGSAVVFPMNDLAQVDTVKNRSYFIMESKGSASGRTSWPLADRGTAWDGGQARKDIQAWAGSDKGKMAQCFFWVSKSPPDTLGDCKLPFVMKSGGSMKAIPQGIISAAGAVAGARTPANIDDVDGVKAKMAVYYRKMKMPPPWEKGKSMDIWDKDYTESYQEVTQMDWISDMWNLWYPLRNEIIVAFQTTADPVADVTKALAQFSEATMAYIARGVELNMAECLTPDQEDDSSMPSMMSAHDNPELQPETKKLSAASYAKLSKAVAGIEGHVKEMKSEFSRQRANALQGYQVYSAPTDDLESKDDEPEESDDEEARASKMREALYDLTARLQFQNADKGI